MSVVTTPFGGRGIDIVDGHHAMIRDVDEIPDAIGVLQGLGAT